MKTPLSWNRLPKVSPEAIHALSSRKDVLPSSLPCPWLAHGNGRSYGDVCLTEQGTLLLTRGMDRFISFDPVAGLLRCEAGVTLGEILDLVMPQGWFLPSTPGTRFATVGGAVANDVHGKNHHAMGSFGHHVQALELLRSNGEIIQCGPDHNPEWFRATVGGLGLTGLIKWVDIRLMPVESQAMWVESRRFENLREFWAINRDAEATYPYTVSWIDCLSQGNSRGRGILFAGRHALSHEKVPVYREARKRIPMDPPFSMINSLTLRVFNAIYYRQPVKPEGALSHYVPYFYPLDAIQEWNRIYGKKGFYQYQCVVPPAEAEAAVTDLLEIIARRRQGSFLAVLKTFGDAPPAGMLSFPRQGATLALDFPDRGSDTSALLNDLDAVVTQAGGALYPAKDARMSASLFQSGFPEWQAFSQFIDPGFSSRFWQRVTE